MATILFVRSVLELNQRDVEVFFESELFFQLMSDEIIKFQSLTYCEVFSIHDIEQAIYQSTSATLHTRTTEQIEMWLKNLTEFIRALCFVDTRLYFPGEIEDLDQYKSTIIMKLLEKCLLIKCNDPKIVVKLLRILDMLNPDNLNYFIDRDFDSFWFLNRSAEENVSIKRRFWSYFLTQARNGRETFEGKWFGKHSSSLVLHCVISGNIDLLTILLEYGFCSNHQEYGEFARKFASFDALFFGCDVDELLRLPCFPDVSKSITVMQLTLANILGVLMFGHPTHLLFMNWNGNLETVQEHFRILFRALPIPQCMIPTHIEEVALGEEDSRNELRYSKQGPCSLKHLSRCAIRQRLGENWMLPDGISNLSLPNALRSYLNLKED